MRCGTVRYGAASRYEPTAVVMVVCLAKSIRHKAAWWRGAAAGGKALVCGTEGVATATYSRVAACNYRRLDLYG